jgi:hypothetical protein
VQNDGEANSLGSSFSTLTASDCGDARIYSRKREVTACSDGGDVNTPYTHICIAEKAVPSNDGDLFEVIGVDQALRGAAAPACFN